MPYLNPFLKLVMIGSLGASEVFSYGLHLIGSTNPPPATVAADVVAACTAYHLDASSSAARLKTIKLNLIGRDGRYVEDTTVQYDFPGQGQPGGQVGNKYPLQVSTAVSLHTTRQRGRAVRGRFYIPSPTTNIEGPDQTIPLTDQVFQVNLAAVWVEALNTALGPWKVGLVSNLGIGAESIVTEVRFGRVYDTIRSRRNKLTEIYVTQPIV